MECVSCCEIEQVANMMKVFDLVQFSDHEGFEHVYVLNMWVLKATPTFLTDMQRYGTVNVWKESQGI